MFAVVVVKMHGRAFEQEETMTTKEIRGTNSMAVVNDLKYMEEKTNKLGKMTMAALSG